MKTRKKVLVKGVVQGIGFRPFIYRLAFANRISGFVKNTSAGVVIECEGSEKNVDNFIKVIPRFKPKGAVISSFEVSLLKPQNDKEFLILKSGKDKNVAARIPADLSICTDCRREIFDPSNRRYLYPFTNCTNCGPRFTIVKEMPYDRPCTTMKKFKMCSNCRAEYENPTDRRFHAQPNACHICGPQIFAFWKGKKIKGTNAVRKAVEILMEGGICSIESLGGFQLACDASNSESVLKLRKAKERPSKPFAVMVWNVEEARNICFVSEEEKETLLSPAAPIVMLKKRRKSFFANSGKEKRPQVFCWSDL